MTIHGNAMQHNKMLRHATSITSNTVEYNTTQHNTVQYNTMQSTEYRLSHRIAPYRATPPPTALPIIPLYSTPRSAAQRRPSTCTNSILLLLLVFFLLRWYVNHVDITMAHAAFLLLLHLLLYHTILYHTTPYLYKLCIATARFYSTLLDWTGAACLSLALVWLDLIWFDLG